MSDYMEASISEHMSVVAKLVTLLGTRDGEHPYECQQCGHRFRLQHHSCPECGGYRVERGEWNVD